MRPARPPIYPACEVICHAPPGRLNEDAWLLMQGGPLGERIVLAAIDGATTRLTPPPLQRYLDAQPVPLTPAAYAARLFRDALARHVAEGMFQEPRALLLEANADLGRALIGLFGALALDRLGLPDEIYGALAHDPRLVRLGLPACVVTLAVYDPADHTLHYAHAGDTALLVAFRDGRAEMPTAAPAGDADTLVKRAALSLRHHQPGLSYRELAQQPEIKKLNLHAALRHNYVDEHGLPQPAQGIGVVDGLPELRYFIQAGSVPLDGASLACVMTDGLEWPPSAEEVFADDPAQVVALAQERREFMAGQMRRRGLAGYLALLRETEADDPDHELFPRFKTHDDATGVLLRFD